MNLFFKAFLFLLLVSPLSKGEGLSMLQKERVKNIISELRKTTHRALEKRSIKILVKEIDNPSYFFQSNFGIGRFLFGINKYKIGVNPIVFKKNIPEDALIGVLGHELIHTEDYFLGSTIGTIIPIGFRVIKKKSRRKYERQTDMKLVQKGLGLNMRSYRLWQYPLLSESDLIIKKKEYLTPEEFTFLEDIRFLYPELINKWIKNPPKDIEGFQKEYSEFINS